MKLITTEIKAAVVAALEQAVEDYGDDLGDRGQYYVDALAAMQELYGPLAASQYIVTIKRDRNPHHDPRNKQTGACPVSEHCTDVTGEHHSFVADDDHIAGLRAAGVHITRIERV